MTEARDCLRLAVACGFLRGVDLDLDLVVVASLLDRSPAIDWRLVHPRR